MNRIFFAIVVIAFGFGAFHEINGTRTSGNLSYMEAISKSMVESASGAVELAIGLVGVMTLFLGLMKVAEAGGMLTILARLIRPLMVRLFPDVPPEHPAMGAMILNFSANLLGLGNAATPFGIRAMQELDKLNTRHGTATNAMALFLAINTSSVTLLPTGVIALRASAGSVDPAGILPTTLFATAGSTLVAVLSAKFYARFFRINAPPEAESRLLESENPEVPDTPGCSDHGYSIWVSVIGLLSVPAFIVLAVFFGQTVSPWILPILMVGFLAFGFIRKVNVYEVFIEGAKEGFQVALRIIPYLVAILVAVGMFRAGGAMEALVNWIGPWTEIIGLPAQALPMALMRPLSGSGAYAILASIIKDPSIGPDSYIGYLVSTIQGCTETTFYVLAVYFGAVQIRRIRHTLAAGLTADVAGVMCSIIACALIFR
jgi:spore maturation protein SpmA